MLEIAGNGLCYACYRKDKRKKEGVHQKLIRRYTNAINSVMALEVKKKDTLAIRDILKPYVREVAEYLDVSDDTTETPDSSAPRQRKAE